MSYFLIADDFMLDIDLFTLSSIDRGQTTRLSKMEVEVLKVLCVHAGKTVARQFIFEAAWVNDTGNNGHLNRVILLLRRKFESLGAHEVIKTIPRVGYSVERAIYFESADLLPFSFEIKPCENKLEYRDGELDIINSNKGGNEHNHEVNNGIYSSKNIIKLAVVVVISVATMLSSQSHLMDTEKLQLGLVEMFHYNESNFSIFYSDEINKSYFKEDAIIKSIKENVQEDFGKYYIGISEAAISIALVESENKLTTKKIYIRDFESTLNDELTCALKDINKNAIERHFEKFNTTVQQGGVIKKHLSYAISSGCPYNVSGDVKWVVDIAFGVNNKTTPYFLSTTKIYNYTGAQLMRVVNDGTVFIETKENRVHNLWMSKTISLDGGAHLQAQVTSEGSDSAFKILEAYSQKNYVAHTIKINNGIYITDFLGGVVVSFN